MPSRDNAPGRDSVRATVREASATGGVIATASATRGTGRLRAELVLRVLGLTALTLALLLEMNLFARDSDATTRAIVLRSDSSSTTAQSALLRAVRTALLHPSSANTDAFTPSGIDARAAAPRVARRVAPRADLHLVATRVPDDTGRALWIAARQAGVPVSWTDSAQNAAIAVDVTPIVDPRGGVIVRVAAPTGSVVAVRDSIGLIDTLRANSGGGRVALGRVSGSVIATSNGTRATSRMLPAPIVRRLLVYAEPGWEAKFTVAALEERGWVVEVRYALGRNVAVTQGAPVSPDTARYAAVLALDSSVIPHVAALRRYALSGGGVVIAGSAATVREFGNMLPGQAGARQPGIPGGLETDAPLSGVAWRPITPDSNAAVIARSSRSTTPVATPSATSIATRSLTRTALPAAVVAKRFGAGRVLQSAYDGVWEWRMAGPEGGMEAHRAWWSELVSAVAFAPEVRQTQSAAANSGTADAVTQRGQSDAAQSRYEPVRDLPGNAAPYADLRAGLGASSPSPAGSAPAGRQIPWNEVLMMIAAAALLAEWSSRRLRGAR